MLISLCRLILEGMLLTTDSGEYKLASFVDEQRMNRLYESLYSNIMQKSVRKSRQRHRRYSGYWMTESERCFLQCRAILC